MSTYDGGFAWAKRLLEAGACTQEIADLAMSNGIDPTEFDRGAREALRQFEQGANNAPLSSPLKELTHMTVPRTFTYEPLASVEEVRAAIKACEGKHVQQVCYSSFMGTLTQLCFTCQRVRSTIDWSGNRSWSLEKPK